MLLTVTQSGAPLLTPVFHSETLAIVLSFATVSYVLGGVISVN